MKYFLIIFVTWFNSFTLLAQNKDTIKYILLNPVNVTSYKEESYEETALNITALKIDSLAKYGNFNLTDLLIRTPGVTMLSTGIGIAKPVIRGLFGNRILVLLSGMKFDNQQWQDEHGLGLSDVGLEKVELIKGPMSVLYGSEAVGGIVNLVEEYKPNVGETESDVSLKFNSNTLGGLLQGGYKVNFGKKWARIRVGIENNADYSDGNNNRILNSRFDGYYLKTSFGFQRKNWNSENNFSSSFNRFGFIFNDIYNFVTPDKRWSRNLSQNPAHLVLLNIFSSENKIYIDSKTKLTVNAGVQSNQRLEKEGGGGISLNMHLLTMQYLAKWERKMTENSRLVLTSLGSFEDNTNFGARKIIPDAWMQEANISAYFEYNLHEKWVFENGVGVGEKWIKTFFTPRVNSPEKEIKPFQKFEPYYNFFSGLTYLPNQNLNLKFNIATGVRIPNLAELSSNGLHEGIFTYEIGDPNLKNEQNIAVNFLGNFKNKYVSVSVTPFYNFFKNYVFLAPTKEDWFGFPVYRVRQQDAQQYGGECSITGYFNANFEATTSYSGMISRTSDGNFIPFTPAQKISSLAQYQFLSHKNATFSMFSGIDFWLPQYSVAVGEKATPAYKIVHLGASAKFLGNSKTYDFSLVANNLLNEAYYDHLSRFKNFGLLNIGRNFTALLKIRFHSELKK